ncbi:hypothetical protein ACFWP5_25275 [Streptomyces sp. NPDC058469]|uniref:hypothetical protein n=1 Tax=Streptomyces sp. NPDC058469 TaxID=3346514 RepID=UPI00365E764B
MVDLALVTLAGQVLADDGWGSWSLARQVVTVVLCILAVLLPVLSLWAVGFGDLGSDSCFMMLFAPGMTLVAEVIAWQWFLQDWVHSL